MQEMKDLLSLLTSSEPAFRTYEEALPALRATCADHPLASWYELGTSEEGRPLGGVVLGDGPITASLIAGNHADEPVGPATLFALIEGLLSRPETYAPLLEQVTFAIVPHTNPDGAARNRPWIEAWPDLAAFLEHRVRELPGRDLEFGYPGMRPENEHVAQFLRAHGPFALHMSLHGMSASEGAMLLINRPWTFRTQPLRDAFRAAAAEAGLPMHDHNRKGEKGFFWIEPGFTTTPRGDAMRTFFRAQDDEAMAKRFHQSSMEFVMSLGGDPLCLVTELPLFLIPNDNPTPGRPERYLAFKDRLPEAKHRLSQDEPIDDLIAPFKVRPLPLATAVRLQIRALELGLEAVGVARG